MLRRQFIFLILCCFLIIGCSQADQSVFYDTDGKPVQLSALKGKWVIVNYWAAWCGACVQEVPELNHFYQNTRDKNIVFYGVDYDELPLANLKASIQSLEIAYPVLTEDPGYAWHLDSVEVIPTTFIINPSGRVVKTITGSNTEQSLLDTIHALQSNAATR